MKHRLISLSLLAFLSLNLIACGTFKPITASPNGGQTSTLKRIAAALLTRATMDDFIWSGSVAAPSNDIAVELANASGDPNIVAGISIAIATGLIEPQGPRLLRITLVGETKPRLFLCRASMAMDCELPTSTGVRVYAKPVSVGSVGVLVIDRITRTN